jgi:hypothetical protein
MARRFGTSAALAIVGVALVLGTTGCTFAGAAPTASPPSGTPSASVEPQPEPRPTPTAAPALRPALSASENLTFFDSVNLAVVAANGSAGGRDFIDALAAAGFDRAAMEVTADTTTIGDPSDSIQFAVLFQGECLVGQFGPASGGYHSAVRPALGTGGCLVGQTRPIDW